MKHMLLAIPAVPFTVPMMAQTPDATTCRAVVAAGPEVVLPEIWAKCAALGQLQSDETRRQLAAGAHPWFQGGVSPPGAGTATASTGNVSVGPDGTVRIDFDAAAPPAELAGGRAADLAAAVAAASGGSGRLATVTVGRNGGGTVDRIANVLAGSGDASSGGLV